MFILLFLHQAGSTAAELGRLLSWQNPERAAVHASWILEPLGGQTPRCCNGPSGQAQVRNVNISEFLGSGLKLVVGQRFRAIYLTDGPSKAQGEEDR